MESISKQVYVFRMLIVTTFPSALDKACPLSMAKRLTGHVASLILPCVNEFEKQQQKVAEESEKAPPFTAETPYPASIEKMSERWREIQQEERQTQLDQRGFVEKNYLAVGVGIALLIIALLVVIGGFAFLIWRAN